MKLGKILKNLDIICDRIPVVSTVTNLFYLFQKHVIFFIMGESNIPRTRYYKHIKNKDSVRSATLLVPVLGNILVAIGDSRKKQDHKVNSFTFNSVENNPIGQRAPVVITDPPKVASSLPEVPKKNDEQIIENFKSAVHENNLETVTEIATTTQDPVVLSQVAWMHAEKGDIKEAYKVAMTIEYNQIKDDILSQISQLAATEGKFEIAANIANSIGDKQLKDETLSKISLLAAAEGEFEIAASIANLIEDSQLKDKTLSEISQLAADESEFEIAGSIANSIGDSQLKSEALSEISQLAAIKSQFKIAEGIANLIGDSQLKAEALSKISMSAAIEGQFEIARDIANLIGDSEIKAEILSKISQLDPTQTRAE